MSAPVGRRNVLRMSGAAGIAGLAGCLGFGDDEPDGTLDFGGFDAIDREALPERKRYATRDGSLLYYRRYEAASADVALVFVHGAGLDSAYLQPFASALAESNVAHVFTPDLRGHGPEPERRGDVGYVGHLEADLADLLDPIRGLHPNASVVVGGHGAGGGLAVRFAGSPRRTLADAYLLLAPSLGRDAPTRRPDSGGWESPYGDRLAFLSLLNGVGVERYNDMTVVEFDLPESVRDGAETPAYTYRLDASLSPPDYEAALSRLEDPCFVAVGGDDEARYAESYAPAFANVPAARTAVVDGASHFGVVFDEAARAPVADWLADRGA